jgi:hypothetical protein
MLKIFKICRICRHLKMIKNKKAALELSVGTIVIIVLAMSMLIMGIVLVRNIFSGATGAVDLVDKNVKAQLNKLFNEEETRTVIYLPNNVAEIKKGKSYNIGFGIKNVLRASEATTNQFTYKVEAAEVETGCQLTLAQADNFIRLGKTLTKPLTVIAGEEPTERTILVEVSDDAPLCSITYDITVYKGNIGGEVYDTNFFILRIAS